MSRHVKRQRPEPMSEEFLALVILFGPFAFLVQWIWREIRECANTMKSA